MKNQSEKQFSYRLNIILPIILILEYVSSVFIDYSTIFNIIAVLLIIALYFNYLYFKNIGGWDIFFTCCSLILIILAKDVARVSILCVFCLFRFKDFCNKKTVKLCLIAAGLSMAAIVIAYFFGFNTEYDTEIYRPLQGITVKRRCYGFVHPNQCTIYLLSITIMVYLITDKLRYYFLITAIDYYFFYYTQSRTVLYVVIFILAAMVVVKLFNLKFLKYHWFTPIVFLLILVGSIFLSCHYAGTKLDVLLSGRLALNKKYLEEGITLFGDSKYDGIAFDNSCVHMLMSKGIIYFIVYSAFMAFMLYKSKFTFKNTVLLTAIMLEAFMEVIFLKYCFIILIPILCMEKEKFENDTENSSLLLVWQGSKKQAYS